MLSVVIYLYCCISLSDGGHRGRDRMVVEFSTA
jgi:hypothetical protein